MRFRNNNQSGFSVVELVIAAAVIAVLGFVGYTVYGHQQDKTNSTAANQTTSGSQPSTTADVSSAPAINSTSDLDTALNTLNQNDPSTASSSDSSQLSSQNSY